MAKSDLSFPWTYDQAQRYAVLRLLVEGLDVEFAGGKDPGPILGRGDSRPLCVLDVGGAAADRSGGGLWLPAREILKPTAACVNVADVSACMEPGFVRASGMRLPFKDGAFDVVSAFDVLEHIPKEARDGFLAELGRVASRAVLLSCPTRSPGVEQAEALLNSEILRRYGTEHGMLTEHRERGLPSEDEVSAALAAAGLEAVSFGYGALSTWLAFLTFRSSFILRGGEARATEAIDRWWCGQPQFAELQAPFYRRFWIGSRILGKSVLERMEGAMKNEILSGAGSVPGIVENPVGGSASHSKTGDGFAAVERAVKDALARPFVSAVIVTKGDPMLLEPCLEIFLTQQVDFDLDFTVWDIENRPENAAWLVKRYPQVFRFTGTNLIDLVGRLRGDFIMIADEIIHLRPDAVSQYRKALEPSSRDAVLAVSAPWRGGFPGSWVGASWNVWKKSKGMSVKAGIVGDTSRIREDCHLASPFRGWVIGDALFFRRIAVHSRKIPGDSIFLWEFKSK
jgi:hypothetical protein